jgi:hypothetical protein
MRAGRIRTALVVGAAFATGVGATAAMAARGDEPAARAETPPATVPASAEAPLRSVSATSPEDAVRGFLTAEQAGDYEASYDFLSDTDRAGFGTAEGWVASHADYVPPVEGFEIEAADAQTVVTLVRYTPSLDAVVGLVPAQARVTWAVTEGQAFGIDLELTTAEALHPSDEGAPAAVLAWAEQRQACAPRPDGQWSGDLLGAPALAEALCAAAGTPAVGVPALLGPAEGAPFSATFGDEVAAWARVVPVDGPVPLRAVVAPLGDDWVVVGVLAIGPGAGL